MPTSVIVNLYKFEELDEDAEKKAIEEFRNFWVEDTEWWQGIYDQFLESGITCEEFDIDHWTAFLVIPDLKRTAEFIIKHWGESEEGWKISSKYLKSDGEDQERNLTYRAALRSIFLKQLQKEFEYLTSDEYIVLGFQNNDYDFLKDGRLAPSWLREAQ